MVALAPIPPTPLPILPSYRLFRAALGEVSTDELNACWRWRVAVQALEAAINMQPLFYGAPLFVVGTKTGQVIVSKGRASLTGGSEPSAPHDNGLTIDLGVVTACGVLAVRFDKRVGVWHLAYVALRSSLSVSEPSRTVVTDARAILAIKEPHLMCNFLSDEDEIGPFCRVESVSEGGIMQPEICDEANGGLDMGHGFEMDSFLEDSAVESTLLDFKANDDQVLQAEVASANKTSSRQPMRECRGCAFYGRDDEEGRRSLAMLATARKSPHVPVIEAANSSSGTKWALPGKFTAEHPELGSKHRDGFSSWTFPCQRGRGDHGETSDSIDWVSGRAHCQSESPEREEEYDSHAIRGGRDEATKKTVSLPEGTVIGGFEDGQYKNGVIRSILKTAERRTASQRAELHVHWCEDLVEEDPAVKAKREMLAERWLRSRWGRQVGSPLCSPVGNRPRAFTMDLEDAVIT